MIIIVMGVSGSGKSTIGSRLAEALQWTFVDGDAFHLAVNIEKMSRGIPLTEADRRPWLLELRTQIERWLAEDQQIVLACSALKAVHRETLLSDRSRMRLIYLKGAFELIAQRLARRRHFMPEELLESQFAILEEPADAVIVDVADPPDQIIERIRAELWP